MVLYALEFGEAYSPDDKLASFRNSVVHRGTIPTIEKARDFCAKVYAAIFSIYHKLREKHPDVITHVMMQRIQARQAKIPSGVRRVSHSATMFFRPAPALAEPDFEKALDAFKTARTMIFGSIPDMQALHDQLKHGSARPA
jgi:hypothetical protein